MEETRIYCSMNGHVLGELKEAGFPKMSYAAVNTNTGASKWCKQSFSLSFDVEPTKELDEIIESTNNIYEWKKSMMLRIFFGNRY